MYAAGRYQMNEAGLTGVAPPTKKRFIERVRQLYEQGAGEPRIGQYIRRWLVWVKSGLPTCDVDDVLLRDIRQSLPCQPHLAVRMS